LTPSFVAGFLFVFGVLFGCLLRSGKVLSGEGTGDGYGGFFMLYQKSSPAVPITRAV
jgi:hypothetical protein